MKQARTDLPAKFSERIPGYVTKVVKRINQAGHQAYPVGGGVRDLLLGRKVTDWDVATGARPEQVGTLFKKVIPTGILHGTVTVMLGKFKVEVTTFRGDLGYSDGRHPDRVIFLKSLREDLKRRDFTINAMAYDLAANRLIDPFGGRRDLARRAIRAVGDPNKRFSEDGLRPLRAIRFACVLDFDIESRTRLAIKKSLAVFRKVANERIREELNKILGSRRARRGIEQLRDAGLLDEILPELLPGIGFKQNRFHSYDVFDHALRSLEKSRGDPVLKLAILLHDLGKPDTAEGPDDEHTFYGHERRSAQLAERVMKRLRFSNQERKRVNNLISNHMFHYQPEWTDGAVRRLIRRVGQENLEDIYEMRRADAWGRGIGLRETLANLRLLKARIGKILARDTAFKVSDLAIGGQEVMKLLNIEPGPRVGQILDALLELVLDDPKLNSTRKLKSLVTRLGI